MQFKAQTRMAGDPQAGEAVRQVSFCRAATPAVRPAPAADTIVFLYRRRRVVSTYTPISTHAAARLMSSTRAVRGSGPRSSLTPLLLPV